MERETIRKIREALRTGKLPREFRASHVNRALGIKWAGTFLPKHRVGNPDQNTEHFVRMAQGLYRVKEDRDREWTFAYGSNMNLDDLRRWLEAHGYQDIGDRIADLSTGARVAVLKDHRLVWNYFSKGRNGGAANVEGSGGCLVYGVAFLLGSEWLRIIDAKENYPNSYTCEKRPVELLPDGPEVEARVYYAHPTKISPTPEWPTPAYKQVVLDGARYWNLPKHWIEELEAVRTR